NSLKIVAQSMGETKSTDPQKLAEHLRKGAKFDVMKAREAYFRPYDNQMVMEMYAVRAKEPAKMKDQWDIYEALVAVPGPNEDLEHIAPPKDRSCKIGLARGVGPHHLFCRSRESGNPYPEPVILSPQHKRVYARLPTRYTRGQH